MEPLRIWSILFVLVGIFLGIGFAVLFFYIRGNSLAKQANKLIEDATKEAEKQKRDRLIEFKEESYRLKQEAEKVIKEKKEELKESEKRLQTRENSLDKRDEILQKRETSLDEKEQNLLAKQKEIQVKDEKVEEILKEEMSRLEKIAKFSKEKARDLILKRCEEEMNGEIAELVKEKEREAKLTANEVAKNIIVESMQRYSEDVATEQTVSTISLPNDELKGRLIGREGRNIRTIEAVTGVDLIIDDTPETIVVSSFDPLRREIAKITIESLIKDGRIHPSRIEEVYDRVSKDMNNKIIELGNEACYDLGITKVDPELVYLIGKLHFRTSYGQNALKHSKEVGELCGLMAAELGENVALAKRAGLLHDIGKSIDYEVEGSHVYIGADIARRYKESDTVINAILSHHGDEKQNNVISVLVQIADTLSAARPGARNDSLDNYIKRLEQLESIGNSFEGVEKTYAMQAGREIRVMVKPEEVSDATSYKIAKDIKERIEKEMQYPGTIKIVVIRESRALEEAK
uniref:ribonuclease Y n=1 Tax=Candidatus Ventrenecus sp. TaxID=3085654 RepID=UPI003FEE37F3